MCYKSVTCIKMHQKPRQLYYLSSESFEHIVKYTHSTSQNTTFYVKVILEQDNK